MRLPFLPTRIGLGTDVMTYNPEFKTIRSPYGDGEVLLAMPAIKLDAALLHVDRADRLGNTQSEGPDTYFDDVYARASERCFVSSEEVHERLDLTHSDSAKSNLFERYYVTGVVHAPFGAHPTSCAPGYGIDVEHLKVYAGAAASADAWADYRRRFVDVDDASYVDAVGGRARLATIPQAVF